ESLWVFATVLAGVRLIGAGSPAGTTLTWYVAAYCTGRFCFEFWRGDSKRPYFAGSSEAQWTSLLLIGAMVWAEKRGILPIQTWHAAALAALMLMVFRGAYATSG